MAGGRVSGAIETARLRLVPCEDHHFEAILSDPERLGPMLGASIPGDALDFPGVASGATMRHLRERLKADPDLLGWWMYLFVHVADGVLVGQGGYKGRPDAAGVVEIGYAISPPYRRRGLATEAARGLVDHAFAHDHVTGVCAHTRAEPGVSTRVLRSVGMEFVGVVVDPTVGRAWRWSLPRSDLASF